MNKYINYIIIIFAFCVPISRAGISITTALLIILWFISLKDDFKTIKTKLFTNKVIIILGSFILYSLISLLYSNDFWSGLRYISKYWYFLVIIVIYTRLEVKYIPKVISAFLFSMLISEIISYGLFFELWHFKHGSSSDPTPFMNHLQYSMFLAFTALLLLNNFFTEHRLMYKYGYFIYFLTVTINLFINGGRTGQIAFMISIFIVGILNIKHKLKAFLIITILLGTILTIAYSFSPIFKHRMIAIKHDLQQVVQNNNFHTSVGIRIGFYGITYEALQEKPIFGHGVANIMTTISKYADSLPYDFKALKTMPHTHNDLLQIVVQLGILGGLLYILLFVSIGKIKIKHTQYKNLPIIFISVFIISSMFENMFHQQFSMVLFTLFVGLFLAQNRIENEI